MSIFKDDIIEMIQMANSNTDDIAQEIYNYIKSHLDDQVNHLSGEYTDSYGNIVTFKLDADMDITD